MLCCITDCDNQNHEWTTQFPSDTVLFARWQAAILAGTGQLLSDITVRSGSRICNFHFTERAQTDNEEYREPTLFIRNSVQLEVASCQLCHRYDTVNNMFNKEDCLGQGQQSLYWMAGKYFRVPQSRRASAEIGYFCESCVVRIDMTQAFWVEISDAAKLLKRLLRKMAKHKVIFGKTDPTIVQTLAQDPSDEEIKNESISETDETDSYEKDDTAANIESIVVKEEPRLVQSDPFQEFQYKCYICNSVLESEVSLLKHLMLDHNSPNLYRCEECNMSFKKPTSFNVHLSGHIVSKVEKFDGQRSHCEANVSPESSHETDHDMLTETRGATDKNNSQHPDKVSANCKICEKPFTSIQNLKRHLNTHSVKLFGCAICGEQFATRQLESIHRQSHPRAVSKSQDLASRDGGVGRNQPMCNLCLETFEKSTDVMPHFEAIHPEKKLEVYPCAGCDEVFFRRHSVLVHQYIHREKYACDQCGKRHYSKVRLDNHRHTYHGVQVNVKEFVPCPVCKRKFKRHNFSKHFRTHSEDKQFSCELCDKRFREGTQLRMHQRIHSGEKPLVCSDCGEGFALSYMLSRHKKTCLAKPLN